MNFKILSFVLAGLVALIAAMSSSVSFGYGAVATIIMVVLAVYINLLEE